MSPKVPNFQKLQFVEKITLLMWVLQEATWETILL